MIGMIVKTKRIIRRESKLLHPKRNPTPTPLLPMRKRIQGLGARARRSECGP
jgi:hypothetical protein